MGSHVGHDGMGMVLGICHYMHIPIIPYAVHAMRHMAYTIGHNGTCMISIMVDITRWDPGDHRQRDDGVMLNPVMPL